ncbi:hypothetical protein IGI04_039263 [Brassica rapa subsp. trilocularis]|uniref:Drought induced 19 protein type zinc-binding domain-containing protein n=1 Tax=Brassica rapa subsp. trilocularis TaxID=1813537 RepID=A0ABQ7KL51_BRACM|nr:hypothetical protein IGI04_039263 [Brassica rapa subsp. trilocularis]
MDDDMWAVSSSGSSRSHRSAATTAKFQSGSYLDSGDFEEDEDDVEVEYPCPFCSDDYDLVELCHHIDEEHSLEATHGKDECLLGVCDFGSGQKETYEEDPYSSSDNYLQDDLSPSMNHHHTSKTDQFLSFLNNSPLPNQTKPVQEVDSSVEDKTLVEDSGKDRKLSTPLSDSEQLEKAKKCEFVQGLLSSAMFDDGCDFF